MLKLLQTCLGRITLSKLLNQPPRIWEYFSVVKGFPLKLNNWSCILVWLTWNTVLVSRVPSHIPHFLFNQKHFILSVTPLSHQVSILEVFNGKWPRFHSSTGTIMVSAPGSWLIVYPHTRQAPSSHELSVALSNPCCVRLSGCFFPTVSRHWKSLSLSAYLQLLQSF